MENFTDKVVEDQLFKDLVVTEAKFDKAIIFAGNKLVSRPLLEIELTVEGRKRPVRKSVLYSFCPFCGKPYEPLKNQEEENANA